MKDVLIQICFVLFWLLMAKYWSLELTVIMILALILFKVNQI